MTLDAPSLPLPENATLAILAGGGPIPALLASAARHKGWPVHVVTFEGQPQPENLELTHGAVHHEPYITSHKIFALGQVGHILAHLKGCKATHVALIGHLNKPSVLALKPDAMGLKLIARAMVRHDDALLRSVTDFLQTEGFTIVGVTDLAPSLQAPEGMLSSAKPTPDEEDDIALGRSVLAVLGDLDIGQAVIVHKGTVLGVEGVEGTDDLIARCAPLRGDASGGVLIKRAKMMQTELADLPCVGPQTVEVLGKYAYRGLCIQAGKTLLLGQEEMTHTANAHNLFLRADK